MDKIRINLRLKSKIPYWFKCLLEDAISAFAKEYIMSDREVDQEMYLRSSMSSMVTVLNHFGVFPEPYDITPFPSYGFLIDKNDSKIVEYILKYGYDKNDK